MAKLIQPDVTMPQPKVNFRRTFNMTCSCGASITTQHEYECKRWLYAHIRIRHADALATLEEKARTMAQCQNGRGYFDDGKQTTGGWHDAPETFTNARRENAAMEMFIAEDSEVK